MSVLVQFFKTVIRLKNIFRNYILGERVPASKMDEHMRIGLLDPAWVEKRKLEIAKKKDEEDYFAPNVQVAEALKNLAPKRTDIFGIDETGVGKEVGEQKKLQQEIGWDGHAKTKDAAISSQFMVFWL